MSISKLVLGLWPIAGVTTIGVTSQDARETLATAIENGITAFDTAYSYGFDGESDRLLGEFLGTDRDRFSIMGKVGQRWDNSRQRVVDGTPKQLTLDAEESLRRIGLDRFDTLYLHAPDPEVELVSLDAHKLWLLEDGHCVRTQVTTFCGVDEREHLGSVTFAAGSFETIRHLIDASEGYTLIPETYARTLSKATRRRSVRAFSDHAPIREVSLIHHKRLWKTDILDALETVVRSTIPRPLARVEATDEILPVRGVDE